MKDLTLEELRVMAKWFAGAYDRSNNLEEFTSADLELNDRILIEIAEREELAAMDFDDCAGGACKL